MVLGYGKEGKSSYALLRDYFPTMRIGIADYNADIKKDIESLSDDKLVLHLGEEYLESIQNYDVVIKSPGVKLRETLPGKHFASC